MPVTAKKPLPEPLLIERCRRSFKVFTREFFEQVPGVGALRWNWHMDLLCEELQEVADRVRAGLPKKHNLVINVCFGTSKSMIASILFQAWVWTNMPEARFLSGTHTDSLVLDLSTRCKDVVKSDKYQRFFPEVKLRADRGAKEDWANTKGGERKCCTVGGVTPTGRHCLPYEAVLNTDIGPLPIGKIVEERLRVRILGFDHKANRLRWQRIQTFQSNPIAPLDRIRLSDGKALELTTEHPIFVKGRGYVTAAGIRTGDVVVTIRGMSEVWHPDFEAEGLRRPSEDNRVLLPQLFHYPPQRTSDGELRGLRGEVQGGNGGERERAGQILLSCVRPQGDRREGTPTLGSEGENAMSRLREKNGGLPTRRRQAALLQLQMSRRVSPRRKAPSVRRTNHNPLPPVRQGVESQSGVPRLRSDRSLLTRMCRQNSLGTDDWEGEQQLYARPSARALQRYLRQDSEGYLETGRASLLPVREDEGRGGEAGDPPHRLGQEERLSKQPCNALYAMPSKPAGEGSSEGAYGEATVVEIERGIRLPDAVYNLSVGPDNAYFANGILTHNCNFIIIDDALDPSKARSELELETAARFMNEVIPSRMVDKEVSVIILVMQRLHPRDPTHVMLTTAARAGATPVRHICLPGELCDGAGELKPPLEELRRRFGEGVYADGLMDPQRLNRTVLANYRAQLLSYGYAGQVLQNPIPPGGGRFRPEWFKKDYCVRAAPYAAVRVRAWDRAATLAGGAATCGTLMARGPDGVLYVEDVVWGQWEPNERNDIIVNTAQRDRLKYGPRNDPTTIIEAERGSTGMESFQHLARRLLGFKIREVKASANKDLRSEPWADQLAAGNVRFVVGDRMTWDFDAWVQEHLLFHPDLTTKRLGGFKDRVDSASHAATWLAGHVSAPGQARVLAFRSENYRDHKKRLTRLVACPENMFDGLLIDDHPTLLVRFVDPKREGGDTRCDEPAPATPPSPENTAAGVDEIRDLGRSTPVAVTNDADGEMGTRTGSRPVGAGEGAEVDSRPGATSTPSPFSVVAGLTKNLGSLTLEVADLDPKDYLERWEEPVAPYGRPVSELVMSREQGKKLWSFLTRKWPVAWEAIIFVGAGGLPLSAARGVAVGMGLREGECVYDVATGGEGAAGLLTGPVPNQHLFDQVKASRSTVV